MPWPLLAARRLAAARPLGAGGRDMRRNSWGSLTDRKPGGGPDALSNPPYALVNVCTKSGSFARAPLHQDRYLPDSPFTGTPAARISQSGPYAGVPH